MVGWSSSNVANGQFAIILVRVLQREALVPNGPAGDKGSYSVIAPVYIWNRTIKCGRQYRHKHPLRHIHISGLNTPVKFS